MAKYALISDYPDVVKIVDESPGEFTYHYIKDNEIKIGYGHELPYVEIEKTLGFCRFYHTGQYRKYSKLQYFTHPVAVASIVECYSNDRALYTAAMLHDTLEDTLCTYEDIEAEFGSRVARLVKGCTNPSQTVSEYKLLPRVERKKIDLEWIIYNPECHLIKAADIYHNMMTSFTNLKYYQMKVIPEKQEVLENLLVPDCVKKLVQSSFDTILSLKC